MAFRIVGPERKKYLSRLIHYYELRYNVHPELPNNVQQNPFMLTIQKAVQMATDLDEDRYFKTKEKSIFVHDISVKPETKQIFGKLSSINKEVFPEIQDTINDKRRGIEALEQEGIVETSHFIIKYDKELRIALEFNQQGARIGDFCNYFQKVGNINEYISFFKYIPIVSSDLEATMASINRCSEITIKVHRDKVRELENINEGIFTAMDTAVREFGNDYATLTLDYDYKTTPATPEANGLLRSLVNKIIANPDIVQVFNKIDVRAENIHKNNKIEDFNLLVDKLTSRLQVEKTPKHRTVVSEDIYKKMNKEFNALKI